MDKLNGIYLGLVKRGREVSGFRLKSGDDFILCSGFNVSLPSNTPLRMEGDYTPDGVFHISQIELDDSNRMMMVRFFSGKSYRGVGKITAERLLDSLREKAANIKTDNITLLPDDLIRQACRECGIDDAIHAKYIYILKKIHTISFVLRKLKKYGSTEKDIENAYDSFGENVINILKKDPYKGIASGMRFLVCDNIAFDNGVLQYDEKRIAALCDALMEYICHSGGCCIRFSEAMTVLKRIQQNSKYPLISQGYMAAAILANNNYKIIMTEMYGIVIYPNELYQIEKNIGTELLRLMKSSEPRIFENSLIQSFLDDDQKKAVMQLHSTGVAIVTGGPGTGKTTVIKEFLRIHSSIAPEEATFLCAPTGRAAVRISEVVGDAYPSGTIHKTLGVRIVAKDQYTCTYTKEQQFPKGLFIVDEMSMVDEKIFLSLLEAIPNGSTLILSGDPDQLPSVSSGTVLKDLKESGVINFIELHNIHRQAEGNSIIDNYYKIKDSKTELIADKEFQIIPVQTDKEALSALAQLYQKYNDDDPRKFQILTTTRKGILGKNNIDSIICNHKKKILSVEQFCPMTDYAVGDKVMMIVNNYERGYWNGDTGVITEVSQESITAKFYNETKVIERGWFEDMEHAWASSVHKAQGSEFDTVILLLDDSYPVMLYNSIVLTAITRAKKKCFIINKGNSLEKSILTKRDAQRMTGLNEILTVLAR